MEENKEKHLKKGGSLTDPAWMRRRRMYKADEQSMWKMINAAPEEPLKVLKEARHQADSPRPVNILAEKAFVQVLLQSFQERGARDRTSQSYFEKDLKPVEFTGKGRLSRLVESEPVKLKTGSNQRTG